MNDLAMRLRQSAEDAECGNGGWATPTSDLMEQAADHIEAQNKLIGEIMFGLRLEFGPAGPSRSTPLGRIFGEWLEEHRAELG